MPADGRNRPVQPGLFGSSLACTEVTNLPLIIDNKPGMIEVVAPGSVYQPLLLSPEDDRVDVGPGKLDANEARFVRDLIHWLYPDKDTHPKSPKTSLKWGDREVWFKRNIEKLPHSFRLRIDESDWFYPDFIVWILDHKARVQTFGFVDPKGLDIGTKQGWADYKVLSTLYMPHVVDRHIATAGDTVTWEGRPWTFRVRGVILSTTPYDALAQQGGKFGVLDANLDLVTPTKEDFQRGRILFQDTTNNAYIGDVLSMLVEDTPVDNVMARLAHLLQDAADFTPESETDIYLQERAKSHQTATAIVSNVVRDWLHADGVNEIGAAAMRRPASQIPQTIAAATIHADEADW